ncbi:MAG: hypothetical protein IFK93_17190, partial [Acidobacteria bacterium]|nr:hypothetical protein [Candidatus Sulfomarinibacter kjeldsenii]
LDDDDSGDFDLADPIVDFVRPLTLDAAGRQWVDFFDGSPDVRVAFGTPRRYFVAVELTAAAGSQTPNQLRVTHITESSSTAEDADHDIPLVLEFSTNVASGTVVAVEPQILTVTKAGTGEGTVTSDPPGIDCGATCAAPFDYGTVVTLTPSPDAGSHLVGWSGNCDPSGQVTMDAEKTCTATFNAGDPEIFDDGFESGDTSAWSRSVP